MQGKTSNTALWELGFRSFFLGAATYAMLGMLVWSGIYHSGWHLHLVGLNPMTWHAHEMIFGFTMAVVAGFLLTAVKNYTGITPLTGWPLALLFLVWVVARVLPLLGEWVSLELWMVVDQMFLLGLLIAAARPVLLIRQKRNMGIMLLVLLILLSNQMFYLGVLGVLEKGQRWGLYAGMYLILLLILTIAGRVIPFFTSRGVGYEVKLTTHRWLELTCFGVFVVFMVLDIGFPQAAITAACAAVLFGLHALRLSGWHTVGIWRKPLLWVLFLAYFAIILGFGLRALSVLGMVSPYVALHAFTVGGFGLMTLGMMARVSLGHTGRSVWQPPNSIKWAFGALAASFALRVLAPLAWSAQYTLFIKLSQLLWILAFLAFLWIYLPILIKPRVDK